MKKTGIYIHVPFCKSKCPYCDFYSMQSNDETKEKYVLSVLKEIESYKGITADTIYLGGGTPSVLSGEQIARIIECAKKTFNFSVGEITVEINPSSCSEDFLKRIISSGVNRISMGMQSFNDNERKLLGRKSTPEKILQKIDLIKNLGIENISLDVMMGIPEQTIESLDKTLDFCINSGVKHISAYILKIEEGTFFDKHTDKYTFPDDDLCGDLYEYCVDKLNKNGFHQYEISNFAKKGFESKHNTKYWNCDEYIGFGPAAHSFLNGKRFYHNRSLEEYCEDPTKTYDDGYGGNEEEYIMLRLRLSDGLIFSEFEERYGKPIPQKIITAADKFTKSGHLVLNENSIHLTEKGFLISNYIISEICDF